MLTYITSLKIILNLRIRRICDYSEANRVKYCCRITIIRYPIVQYLLSISVYYGHDVGLENTKSLVQYCFYFQIIYKVHKNIVANKEKCVENREFSLGKLEVKMKT